MRPDLIEALLVLLAAQPTLSPDLQEAMEALQDDYENQSEAYWLERWANHAS